MRGMRSGLTRKPISARTASRLPRVTGQTSGQVVTDQMVVQREVQSLQVVQYLTNQQQQHLEQLVHLLQQQTKFMFVLN